MFSYQGRTHVHGRAQNKHTVFIESGNCRAQERLWRKFGESLKADLGCNVEYVERAEIERIRRELPAEPTDPEFELELQNASLRFWQLVRVAGFGIED